MNPQATISWNRFYCVLMALSQLSVVIGLFCIYVAIADKGELTRAEGDFQFQVVSLLFAIYVPLICGGIFSAILIFAPRTKFWWWAHLFHQILGLGTCIFFAIPLLIFWSREPVMDIYFGRSREGTRRRKRKRK